MPTDHKRLILFIFKTANTQGVRIPKKERNALMSLSRVEYQLSMKQNDMLTQIVNEIIAA